MSYTKPISMNIIDINRYDYNLAFTCSDDGRFLFIASDNHPYDKQENDICIYSTKNGLLSMFKSDGYVASMTCTKKNTILIATNDSKSGFANLLVEVDITGKFINKILSKKYDDNSYKITKMHANGNLIVLVSKSDTTKYTIIELIDITTLEIINVFSVNHTILSCKITPDHSNLLILKKKEECDKLSCDLILSSFSGESMRHFNIDYLIRGNDIAFTNDDNIIISDSWKLCNCIIDWDGRLVGTFNYRSYHLKDSGPVRYLEDAPMDPTYLHRFKNKLYVLQGGYGSEQIFEFIDL